MSQNDHFSFIRCLKVVKTLYESSTFTQLGMTVGSALGYKPVMHEIEDDDGTLDTLDRTFDEDNIIRDGLLNQSTN